MTTFKGFVRSTNAALNRMERAHQQRVRYAEKIEKLRMKEQMLATAAQAVQQYNELITLLTSVHKEVIERVDWMEILQDPMPVAPAYSNELEQAAAQKLSHYSPSFLDQLFGAAEKKKGRLEQNIEKARARDSSLFEQAQTDFVRQYQEWEEMQRLANGILKKSSQACADAVIRFNPLAEVKALTSSLALTFHGNYVVADLLVRENDILPRQVLTLTSTGKLSKKDMAVSKFNELYQDHVCSCLLRVGREMLALLPVEFVLVNAKGDLLNAATGRMGQKTIVSAAIFPENLARLQFDTLDPSEAMKNFKTNMDFSKTSGFRPVEPLLGIEFSGTADIPLRLEMGGEGTGADSGPMASISPLDQEILRIYQEKGALHATKFYKDQKRTDLRSAKDHVDQLAAAHGLKKGGGGCAGVVLLFVLAGVVYYLSK